MQIRISNGEKQGRIHGNPVADGWTGAVMQKLLAILEVFPTNLPTYRHGKVQSRVSAGATLNVG